MNEWMNERTSPVNVVQSRLVDLMTDVHLLGSISFPLVTK